MEFQDLADPPSPRLLSRFELFETHASWIALTIASIVERSDAVRRHAARAPRSCGTPHDAGPTNLAGVNAPTLVIHCDRDRAVPPEEGRLSLRSWVFTSRVGSAR
jgi:pimeloyl-ACP methyl ester carboxylesterase